MKKIMLMLVIGCCTLYGFGQTRHPRYGGGHHTTSHGGYYSGSHNSHHKGGHYVNRNTSNTYGKHKR